MKKWLLALGITGTLVAAGCSGDSGETEETTETNEQTETSGETEENDASIKKELLNAQMNVEETFSPYQQKITAYVTAATADEPDAEAIKAAAEEAIPAAKEAAEKAANYTVEADLPEEVKAEYQEAVQSLKAYYEEVASALEANSENADLTKANELFTAFNDSLSSIYEEADLFAPDMSKSLG